MLSGVSEQALLVFLAPLILITLAMAWVAMATRGKRPFFLHIKGLGVELSISPCGPKCPAAMKSGTAGDTQG